jgi:predicted anti-sigma-YlaC factor YlaD
LTDEKERVEPLMHTTEEGLELFALKLLNQDQIEEVEEHLLVCESCRTLLERVEEGIAILRRSLTNLEFKRLKEAKSSGERGRLLIFRKSSESI